MTARMPPDKSNGIDCLTAVIMSFFFTFFVAIALYLRDWFDFLFR